MLIIKRSILILKLLDLIFHLTNPMGRRLSFSLCFLVLGGYIRILTFLESLCLLLKVLHTRLQLFDSILFCSLLLGFSLLCLMTLCRLAFMLVL